MDIRKDKHQENL